MAKKNEMNIIPLFANPLTQIQLDLDTDKLTEFALEMWNKDKKGVQVSNIGGWQSNDINKEKHKEFIRLKKEINQHLQIYHSVVFQGMVFKENVVQNLDNMWVNINEKYHYNEWHIHPMSTLSGVYYIKHNGCVENGDIMFKHPISLYLLSSHWPDWPEGIIKGTNEVTSWAINVMPKSNMLLIFPSWLEHKAEMNLKDDTRISLSFNTFPIPDKSK